VRSLWAVTQPPAEKPEPGLPWRDQVKLMRRILPLMWPERQWGLKLRVIVALFLIVVGKGVNAVVPIFYKWVVDSLSGVQAALAVPLMLVLAYAVARIIAQATGEIRDLIFAKVHERGLRLISLHVLRHLHALSLRFHLERQTGGLSRAIERGAEGIEFLISFLVFHIGPALLELLLVAGLLWHFFDFSFAAVTLAVIVLYAAYTAFGTRWRMKYRREVNTHDREANARAIDSLLNYETVKYFGNEAHEVERFDEAKRDYVASALLNQRALSWFNIGQAMVLTGGIAVTMVMAAHGVVGGRMTLGDFVMVNAYLIQLYQPLNMFGWIYRNLRQSMTDIEQMYELLEEQPEVDDAPGAPALTAGPGRIVFDRVGFAYDPRRPILHDVSFETPPGHTTAIVGPTGSGKTTIARLLFRFYDPQEGHITIDGQGLKDVRQETLRRAIGVVPQDAVLFNDTIAYNIAYGRPDATNEDVEEAARQAHLSEFIAKLPDGYLTRVGERGLKLSGGEKQRVAIARVVLKNPRILIFDEATSSLDSRTEHEIQKNLREVQADRTTVVIAHRLSTIVDADEILVLHEGHVVERGRHQALLARGGMYAAMWDKQRVAQQLAEVAE
jgi:ATP-binding cassette subfamily B protein